MRGDTAENIQFPTDYTIIAGTLTSGGLANLQASDDSYMVFTSEQVGADQMVYVVFTGTQSGHMAFLQWLTELKTSVAVTYILQAWNYSTGAYDTSGTMYLTGSTSTSDVNYYRYSVLNNRNYRDASGNWQVRIQCKRVNSTSPFTASFDYMHFRTVAFNLGTAQSGTQRGNDTMLDGLTVGIRVWKVNADDTETEITAGSSVATVTGPSQTIELDGTYTPPATANVVAIVVRIYKDSDILRTADLNTGGLPLVFITEDLNTTLTSAQWTVHYSFWYSTIMDETYLMFGASPYDTRITNFTYGVVRVPQLLGDGLTWVG